MLKLLFTFAILLVACAPVHAAIGAWQEGDHARLRLVADRMADGSLEGVIEIELESGWKTYWRSPGDAGIPPRLDFGASSGVSAPTIEFPPPERSDDGFSVSNVYHDRVALPFRFANSAAGQTVRLDLAADLGICQEICLPVSFKAGLDVPSDGSDSAAAGIIAEARAALPGPGRPGAFEILSLKRVGGTDKMPVFEATVRADGPGDAMLFVETPADWYPAPPAPERTADAGETRFRFEVDRKSATSPIGGAQIRLTLTEGDAATERSFYLDGGGSGL